MEIIIHRINTISELKLIPQKYGCEIDIRANGSRLILNHEPFKKGETLSDYLDNYNNGTLILNIKEAGIEEFVLAEVRKRNIQKFFLLDVEFPYLFRATRNGERSIAIRYSEDEPIEFINLYKDKVDWIWVDTITKLPLDYNKIKDIQGNKVCLVCPERWGRPNDIILYKKLLKEFSFKPTAVMTNILFAKEWEEEL